MGKITSRIKGIFLEILPAFIFFLIMFHMLLIGMALVLKQHGMTSGSSAVAVISAYIVAKAVFIANSPVTSSTPHETG